jgi:hypothetical protein
VSLAVELMLAGAVPPGGVPQGPGADD